MFWIFLAIAAFWGAVIYLGGSSKFGRDETQKWIDTLLKRPGGRGLARFLNRRHGMFRASFHYIEFGALCAISVGVVTLGTYEMDRPLAILAYGFTCLCAYLDELHQAKTPGRQFRRIDVMHGILGASLVYFGLILSQFLLK